MFGSSDDTKTTEKNSTRELVTFKVPFPDIQGHTMVHAKTSIVPEVGEEVSALVNKDDFNHDFVVEKREYKVAEKGVKPNPNEHLVQAIITLKHHPNA